MFVIKTHQELLDAFRPRDRRTLELPEPLSFPLVVRDYLAWVETAGTRVYLLFQDPASRRPLGIAFRRDSSGGGAGQMCDWCHSFGTSDEIGLLTTDKSSRRRVGVGLCRDLRCGEKLDQAADLAGRSSREPRRRLLERMQRFAREGLGIAAVPPP